MTLPNYDAWKLASPPENEPCTYCRHEFEAHAEDDGPCMICSCLAYTDDPSEPGMGYDPDLAYKRRLEGL